jgi:hypothetical protein
VAFRLAGERTAREAIAWVKTDAKKACPDLSPDKKLATVANCN